MILSARGLHKDFKSYKKAPGFYGSIKALYKRDVMIKRAVHPFNVDIDSGEIVALLGPNGAGKTTLMKMFTGIIVPSGGELSVLDEKPWERDKDFRKKISLVMGQKSQLWWDIPAMDSFLLLQKYYEIKENDFRKRLNELSEKLNVGSLLEVHVRKLSLGERMKMELMSCLLHRPKILFLDEPTIGLDLVAQNNIRNFIFEYHKEERPTIILTSHYMNDIEALCKRLVLLIGGEKLYDGDLLKFSKILGKEKNVSFSFSQKVESSHWGWEKYDARWNQEMTKVDLRVPESQLRSVSGEIIQKFPVVDFHTERMPIERVLKALMKNPKILQRQL